MATTDAPVDAEAVASHTLAYLRSHGKKLDLVLETLARHGERLGRLEREVGEGRRDVLEIKSDIALLENKVLSAQTEMLAILHRLEVHGIDADEEPEMPPPNSAG
jgi:hypothetical protein